MFRSVIIDPFPWVCFRIPGALVHLTAEFEVKRFEGNSMGKNVVCFYCVCVWVYVNCHDLFFGVGLE